MRKTAKQIDRTAISLFFLFSLFSLSCRSTPTTSNTTLLETGFLPLDPGAAAYIVIDVINARPLLDNFDFIPTGDKQVKQMIDRTHSAVAAVYSSGNERRYQVAAWGRYPASRARMAFGVSRHWKKQRSANTGASYWHSASGRLSIAIDPQEIFVAAATGDSPADPFSAIPGTEVPTGTKIPDGFGEFGTGAILSCWIDRPAPLINQKLREMEMPIELPAEQVFIRLFPADDSPDGEQHYTANVRMEFSSPAQARGLVVILSLARGFLPTDSIDPDAGGSYMLAAILFSNPPVQDGRSLTLTTDPLNATEISLLFGLFSL